MTFVVSNPDVPALDVEVDYWPDAISEAMRWIVNGMPRRTIVIRRGDEIVMRLTLHPDRSHATVSW